MVLCSKFPSENLCCLLNLRRGWGRPIAHLGHAVGEDAWQGVGGGADCYSGTGR